MPLTFYLKCENQKNVMFSDLVSLFQSMSLLQFNLPSFSYFRLGNF